jgi:alanyl-tRNA synthetase
MLPLPLGLPHAILHFMKCKQLFYDRPSLLEADALIVLSVPTASGQLVLELDQTPFYPEGGGQPFDLGTINGQRVVSVIKQYDRIIHTIEADGADSSLFASGSRARCVVDAARRLDHSRQHTAQHLLSATVLRLLGAPTKSFHLGERYSTIDVDTPVMDRADADTVETAVLEVIRDDYPIITHLCPPEDPDTFPLRRKPPTDAEVLRILEIDGIDYTPCAGTHLQSSGAILAFRILKTEKYKGMTRIYFLAGERAQDDYMRLAASVRQAAAVAGCAEDDVPAFMAGAMEKTVRLESELKGALDGLAIFEMKAVLDGLPGGPGIPGIEATVLEQGSGALAGFVLLRCTDRDYAGVARLAKAGAVCGRSTMAASLGDAKIAASTTVNGTDLGKLLKPLLQIHGGKGGGSSFFQAAFAGSGELSVFLEALEGPSS